MAEKRKIRKKKDDEYELVSNKGTDKPTKDETMIAKWLKENVLIKKTKFAGHNVEYFTGSKAVDALMNSKWTMKEGDKEPFFVTRHDAIYFLDTMLRHRFFHRAKKVPVSEQELKAKLKKKDRKSIDDEKKKKDEETAESSYAEGKDIEEKSKSGQEGRLKNCKKIKLEMYYEQMFVDNFDAYVWIYDPIPFYYYVIGALVVLATVGICLFPLWPPTVRLGVQYISMAAAGFLILILALAVLRVIIFCLIWLVTGGSLHMWLLPNLTEDVGFFASFWPLYQYNWVKKEKAHNTTGKDKKIKKKKMKDSDGEDTTAITTPTNSEKDENDAELVKDNDECKNQINVDFNNKVEEILECDEEQVADDLSKHDSNDSETDTESSSQPSQTGKDFEMVENEE